jgi:hypothetical protein
LFREGLIVVESFPRDPRPRDNYKGFDGEFWPGPQGEGFLADGLAPLSSLTKVLDYFAAVSGKFRNARLILISESAPTSAIFEFSGFDAGVLESSYNHFSIVLNDILNPHGAFTSFAGQLNRNELFSDQAQAASFCQTRSKYLGQDAETFAEGIKIEVFPIWLYAPPK